MIEDIDKCEVYSNVSCKSTETSSLNTKTSAFALIYFQDNIWTIGGFSNETYTVATVHKKIIIVGIYENTELS